MDWSLVLISQGIAAEILRDENGWNLSVSEADHERARQAIELYRVENRGWKWKQQLPVSGLIFHWGSIFWAFAMLWLYYWTGGGNGSHESIGIMSSRGVASGEWWRLFTATTMHADYAHLAANVTTGFVLIGLAMARYGVGFGLLTAYLSGVGGNILGYVLYDQTHRGLGASGVVMGALGLLAVQPFYVSQTRRVAVQIIFRGLIAAALMFILMGTTPGTDVIAHLGGFLFGIVFGILLNLFAGNLKETVLDKIVALVVPALVILTWGLALATRH